MRSIVGIVSLCAMMGTMVTIEADGADEDAAIQTLESAFSADENDLAISQNTSTDQRE